MPETPEVKRLITITKRYSRTVANDAYQSFGFETILSETAEVSNREEFLALSDKLYNQAKGLTDLDIESALPEIQRSRKVTTIA